MEACSHDEQILDTIDLKRKLSKDSAINQEDLSYPNKSMGTPHHNHNELEFIFFKIIIKKMVQNFLF